MKRNLVLIIATALIIIFVAIIVIFLCEFTYPGCGGYPIPTCENRNGICAKDCESLEGLYVLNHVLSGKEGKCEENEVCCIPIPLD